MRREPEACVFRGHAQQQPAPRVCGAAAGMLAAPFIAGCALATTLDVPGRISCDASRKAWLHVRRASWKLTFAARPKGCAASLSAAARLWLGVQRSCPINRLQHFAAVDEQCHVYMEMMLEVLVTAGGPCAQGSATLLV